MVQRTKVLKECITFSLCSCTRKHLFGAIDRTKVEWSTENFENVGAVSSKLIELRKSPSPALIKEILKLEACKVIKQHVVSTPVTESQMPIKYLKDVSTVLAVISAVREDGLCHINYARHSTYQHVCLNKKSWKKKIWDFSPREVSGG